MDVALDPIPYGGATTTAEALWMGVPVISMKGEGWLDAYLQACCIMQGLGSGSRMTRMTM